MYAAYKTSNAYYMIFDAYNGSDLLVLKQARGKLTEKEARPIILQIV